MPSIGLGYTKILISGDNWAIPIGKYGNMYEVREYMPEPYWGWTPNNKNKLKAVFLNLNPGEGGDDQRPVSASPYIATARINYQSMVDLYSKNDIYETTKWFQRKRADWLSNIFPIKFKGTKANEILCGDLIPWHTPTYNSATASYTKLVHHLIDDHVIHPLSQLSKEAELRNTIIGKGAHIEQLLSDILPNPITYYDCRNNKKRVSVFKRDTVSIIVYVGGQGMNLPKSNITFCDPITGYRYSFGDIILNTQISWKH